MKCKKVGNARIYHESNKVFEVAFFDKEKGMFFIEITRSFAKNGGTLHGIKCDVNGTGPSNNKLAYWACQQLFFADEFELASFFHDVIGSLGIMATDFKTWNLIWYHINKIEAIPKVRWYKRFMFHVANRYGLRLLNKYGRSSWGKGGNYVED